MIKMGIQINSKAINNLRYIDDAIILAGVHEDL